MRASSAALATSGRAADRLPDVTAAERFVVFRAAMWPPIPPGVAAGYQRGCTTPTGSGGWIQQQLRPAARSPSPSPAPLARGRGAERRLLLLACETPRLGEQARPSILREVLDGGAH